MSEKQLLIPPRIQDQLTATVRNELAKLPAQKQQEFIEEFKRKGKDPAIGLILAFLGFHYAYLGKWGFFIIYLFTWGGLLIWWLIDLFRVQGLVRNHNQDVSNEIMRNIKIMSS